MRAEIMTQKIKGYQSKSDKIAVLNIIKVLL